VNEERKNMCRLFTTVASQKASDAAFPSVVGTTESGDEVGNIWVSRLQLGDVLVIGLHFTHALTAVVSDQLHVPNEAARVFEEFYFTNYTFEHTNNEKAYL